jgi:hypothetical protein
MSIRTTVRFTRYGIKFAPICIAANRLLSSLKHTTLQKLILLTTGNGLLLGAKHSNT